MQWSARFADLPLGAVEDGLFRIGLLVLPVRTGNLECFVLAVLDLRDGFGEVILVEVSLSEGKLFR